MAKMMSRVENTEDPNPAAGQDGVDSLDEQIDLLLGHRPCSRRSPSGASAPCRHRSGRSGSSTTPKFSTPITRRGICDDGLSIDPWIGTDRRMGARIVGPVPSSMVVPGTVVEWETWAYIPLSVSGHYMVLDALNLVHVDRESDEAVCREENLRVRHG